MTAVLLLLGVAWVAAPQRVRRLRRFVMRRRVAGRRRRALVGLADLSHGVARRLLVGESLTRALSGAGSDGPLATEVETVMSEHAAGLPVQVAVENWAKRLRHRDLDAFSAVVGLATGPVGPRPELFDHLAIGLRSRAAIVAEARTQASQARLSVIVVAALPWTVALAMALEGGAAGQVLVEQPIGHALLAAAATLDALGLFWMKYLVDRATS